MKKALALLALIIPASASLHAQTTQRCGFDVSLQEYFSRTPGAEAQYLAEREAMLAEASAEPQEAQKTTAANPIPVIFHIVLTQSQINQLSNGGSSIQARCDSSIAVLNRDYNRRNSDSTLIPAIFKPAYGNADIQFGLARTAPNGQATVGYEVYVTGASSFPVGYDASAPGSQLSCAGAKYSPSQGGSGLSAWDNTKYLNIWVCNISNSGGTILGVATPPSLPFPSAERGVVLNYGAFGKGSAGGQYFISGATGSRTLVHEIGHYLALAHVFGNNAGCPGSGDIDDGVSDTPPQDDANYGCPSSIPANTCSSSGRMYVNYMDYSDDQCLVMFTNGQANIMRVQTSSGGPSFSLTQNPSLLNWPASVSEIAKAVELSLSPNPARTSATLSYKTSHLLKNVEIVDAFGRVVRTPAVDASAAGILPVDLSGLSTGVYSIRANFEAGTVTQKLVVQ